MANLRQMAEAYVSASGYVDSPVLFRQFNAVLNFNYVVMLSSAEPVNRVLPLNVIWLCLDKTSVFYMKFLLRKSKNKGTIAALQQSWEPLRYVSQLWEPQYYAPEDNQQYSASIVDATKDVAGVVKLSYPSASPTKPRLVTKSDPRLSDRRRPTAHSHAEKAMRIIKTLTGQVDLTLADADLESATLVADSPSVVRQRKLKRSEVI